MQTRAAAAKIIYEIVVNGRSLTESLNHENKNDPREASLLQAICYGVCRWYYRLDFILSELLSKPLKAKDEDVFCLLLVGLYQLTDMRIPEHAAVSETVAAVPKNKIWAKSLTNAILRNYLRQADDLKNKITDDDEAFYSHPEWMIAKIKQAWPDEWKSILNANNQHPPFTLRVNQKHITREKYLSQLTQADIIPETRAGIMLAQPMDVKKLPGFAEGDVTVQDGAAQLAAELLNLQPGQRVLDACAAPGGKTTHILETENHLDLTAIDSDAQRLETVKDNLQRLKLTATCKTADVGDLSTWWDGQLFDRVLLDAPCSASGVIRRHPDIKLLRRETDIAALAKIQLQLLQSLWTVLKPGGLLVYATCSIFPEENAEVLQQFLKNCSEAREEKISANWGIECKIGRQILPGMHNMDGFYYARLRK